MTFVEKVSTQKTEIIPARDPKHVKKTRRPQSGNPSKILHDGHEAQQKET